MPKKLFCIPSMKNKKSIYSISEKLSAVFMIVALLWLTVSAPFVLSAQQQLVKQGQSQTSQSPANDADDDTNPFGNNTEEKAPSSSSFSEEFLHDNHSTDHFFSIILRFHSCEKADTYEAFHGELLVPPPNMA